MFKLNKILIKRGFKSLWKTKFFSALMMILIAITGTTYTILSQSASALNQSYNQVKTQGHLHDHVLKSGFRFSNTELNNSKLNYGLTDSAGNLYDLTNPAITAQAIQNLAHSDQSVPGHERIYFIAQAHKPTGIYAQVDPSATQQLYLDGDLSIKQITSANLKSIIAELQAKIKAGAQNILNQLQANLSTTVVEKLYQQTLNGKPYSDYLYLRDTHSLYVQDTNKSFNIVDHDINPIAYPSGPKPSAKYVNDLSKIDSLVMYDGTSSFTQPLTDAQFKAQLEWYGASFPSWTIDKSLDYRQIARPPTSDPTAKSISFTDPLAYEAVVSPGYANKNGKQAISMSTFINLFSQDPYFGDKIATDPVLQAKYQNNLITVGHTPYFIIGIGTQPDYAYPIMNARQPVVDEQNQAVVFVANRGYERIQEAFQANPTENYIALKFKPGVSHQDQNTILSNINADLKGANNFPVSIYANSNVKLITTATEANDHVLLTEERVLGLEKINRAVGTLAYSTTTLLILFLLSIIIMILKALISGTRKIYATLHALGYSKVKIALSNALTAFVLMALPMFLAYGIGYGLQFVFLNQFANTWTIPTYGTSFSWTTLLVIILVPTLILFAIIVAITLFELRYAIPKMLSGSADYTFSGIARLTSKFKILSIQSKYVVALSLKNVGKLALLFTSALIAMSALMVGIGTIGRANYAYNQTAQMNKYQYAVDLVSPTQEGGQYRLMRPFDPKSINPYDRTYSGTRGVSSMPLVKDTNSPPDPTKPLPVTWQIPSTNDINFTDPTLALKNLQGSASYLKNKIQNKAILDTGKLSSSGLSVWDIAERLMPDNQKNQANTNFNVIMHKIFDQDLGPDVVDGKSVAEIVNAYQGKKTPQEVHQMIQDFFDDHLIKSSTMGADGNPIIPYTINYDTVLVNQSDEAYTYLAGYSTSLKTNINIKGLKDSAMVNVKTQSLNNLKLTQNNGTTVVPILVNKYLAKAWSVHKGSTIDYAINNAYKRFADPQHDKNIKVQLKVQGIINGYNDTGIYTSQQIANTVLGLSNDPKNPGFNGVFTTSKDPIVLNSLALYSPSGLYFPTDSFNVAAWKNVLNAYLKANPNQFKVTNADAFISKYGATPFTGLTSNVRWNVADKIAFKNITDITSTIIMIIEAISITLSVIFTIIVAALLFRTNSKKIAALWALGYRRREINRMFLSMYIVPLVLALLIAIPISFAVLLSLQVFIINFGHILIPLVLTWWIPIVAFAAVSVIFIAATSVTIFTRGTKATLEAFKGD